MKIPKTLTKAQRLMVADELVTQEIVDRVNRIDPAFYSERILNLSQCPVTAFDIRGIEADMARMLDSYMRPGSVDQLGVEVILRLARVRNRPTASNLHDLCIWCHAFSVRANEERFDATLGHLVDRAVYRYPAPKKGKTK